MKYVIPSYQRVNTLRNKTLSMLCSYNVPTTNIFIFTAPEEYELYKKEFPEYNVVRGLKGLMEQRNFITAYFEEGEQLVCIDDDVEQLLNLGSQSEDSQSENPKIGLSKLQNLGLWVESIFQELESRGLSLAGIYPIANSFFMKPTITTNLKFCIGHFWLVINRKDIKLTLCYKEDFERTILFYIRDKGVLRINSVCAKTIMGKEGGLGKRIKDRLEDNIKSTKYLIKTYPQYVIKNKRRDGEVLLKRFKETKLETIND